MKTLLMLFCTFFCIHLQCQNIDVDIYLDSLFNVGDFNGLVVVKDSVKTKFYSRGYRDIENKEPIQNSNTFKIASVSKVIYATWLLEQNINVNEKVVKYLQDIPDTSITLLDLLNHTSNIEPYFFVFPEIYELKNDNSIKGIYDYVLRHCFKNIGKPKRFEYTNENYFLIGLIIEKIQSDKFQNIMTSYFKRIGMLNTIIDNEIFRYGSNSVIPNFNKKNVDAINFKKEYEINLLRKNIFGDGDIETNLEDILRFGDYVINLPQEKKDVILNSIHIDSNLKVTNAYGFFLNNKEGKQILWHGGYLKGNATNLFIDLKNRKTFFIINNKEKKNKDGKEFSKTTLNILNKIAKASY
jgi:hypothetical protein